jgi:hypothetical protein
MKRHSRCVLGLQALESRLVPTVTIVNATTAKFTDIDGDLATIKVSKGTLTAGLFTTTATGLGDQLQAIDFRAGGFDGADLTFSIVKVPGGDGLANVGYINSTDHDLGRVRVKGDLGQIDAGDAQTTLTPGLRALFVRSLGRFGTDTQVSGGNLESNIQGKLGTLVVARDVKDAFVNVAGGGNGVDGKIGAITIGGSLIGGSSDNSGRISSSGNIGMVRIAHDVQGGSGSLSGLIESVGKLTGATIGGSVIGSSSRYSGNIGSIGDMGAVTVRGNVQCGSGDDSGRIWSFANVVSVSIGGSLIGGTGARSGEILCERGNLGVVRIAHDLLGGSGVQSGYIECHGVSFGNVTSVSIGGSLIGGSGNLSGRILAGDVGAVTIGRDLLGGSGILSGYIQTHSIAAVSIGGSLIGGVGDNSGGIECGGDLGAVKIGHDLLGGPALGSGHISGHDNVASVSIGGSLIGGSGHRSGEIASIRGDIAAVSVGHDMRGGLGSFSAWVVSFGKLGAVSIGGSLIGGAVGPLGSSAGGNVRSDGDMGTVRIGHDVVGGSITGSDSLNGSGTIVSQGRISSVTIGGSIISGTDTSTGTLTNNATIRAANDIASIIVRGNLIGNTNPIGDSPVVISARGQSVPGLTTDLAIGKVTIDGRGENARILAGYEMFDLIPLNADAQIGSVTIGGDWIGSSIAAGVVAGGDSLFGTADDAKISGPGTTDNANIVSRIASITIAGAVYGTPTSVSGTDHYGFVAQQIGIFTAGGFTATLTAATDPPLELALTTGDVTLREVA